SVRVLSLRCDEDLSDAEGPTDVPRCSSANHGVTLMKDDLQAVPRMRGAARTGALIVLAALPVLYRETKPASRAAPVWPIEVVGSTAVDGPLVTRTHRFTVGRDRRVYVVESMTQRIVVFDS